MALQQANATVITGTDSAAIQNKLVTGALNAAQKPSVGLLFSSRIYKTGDTIPPSPASPWLEIKDSTDYGAPSDSNIGEKQYVFEIKSSSRELLPVAELSIAQAIGGWTNPNANEIFLNCIVSGREKIKQIGATHVVTLFVNVYYDKTKTQP